LSSLRVAVITPYFGETLPMLRQAHESVLAQTYPCRHILVADGRPKTEVEGWDADHLVLPRSYGDFGSTPTFVGASFAAMQGYDLIALLDSDNWFREDHIERVLELEQSSGAAFLSSGRMLCRLDGSVMAFCPLSDPERFIDTSCMAFTKAAFPLLARLVTMPDYAHGISDRVLYHHILSSGTPRAHCQERTVFYRCGKSGIYELLGEPVPDGVMPPPDYRGLLARWVADGNPPLI